MFSTFDSGEISIPPIFDYCNEKWWAYVHVPLFTPYFHMVIEFAGEEEGDRVSKTVLYHNAGQVVDTANEEDVTVVEVQVVLPNHKTKEGRWTMEQLAELLVGLEPGLDHEQTALVYVLENGARIVDSALSTPEEDLEQLQTWFQMNRQA